MPGCLRQRGGDGEVRRLVSSFRVLPVRQPLTLLDRNCPSCKQLRRASKVLSLSRLPPVLLIHLKRFSVKGHFTEKIETFIDFPLRSLDLTNYMPPPLPPGVGGGQTLSSDDPRAQIPPYRYDLYGVTNHYGTLSSGHCKCSFLAHWRCLLMGLVDTACISSRGGWLYCDDSRITAMDAQKVVVSNHCFSFTLTRAHKAAQDKRAYILFYKRTKA